MYKMSIYLSVRDLSIGEVDNYSDHHQNADNHGDEPLLVSAYAFHRCSVQQIGV